MDTVAEVKQPSLSLHQLMERRYEEAQGWLLFYEVANGTGYKGTGFADALALSTWPSKGIALHGFEFKRSRSDLIKEMRDERKAEVFQKYCLHWWLVVSDAKIAEGVEVPATWGILAPRNGVLYQVRAAPKLEPEPWKPEFIAALMRRFYEAHVKKDMTALQAAVEERAKALSKVAVQKVDQSAVNLAKREAERYKGLYEALDKRIKDFEDKSGIPVNGWQASNVGDLLGVLQGAHGQTVLKNQLTQARDSAARIKKSMDGALKNLEQMGTPKIK